LCSNQAKKKKKDTSSTDYGVIQSGSLKGVRVCALIGDQQSALLGQECIGPGQVKATYGTGVFVLLHTGENAVISKSGLLSTVAYTGPGLSPQYALEGSVASGGSVVTWLRVRTS
jgi:glycerol kinase